jgi:hypothetical protein
MARTRKTLAGESKTSGGHFCDKSPSGAWGSSAFGRTRRLPEGAIKMPQAAAFFPFVSVLHSCSTTQCSLRRFSSGLFDAMNVLAGVNSVKSWL